MKNVTDSSVLAGACAITDEICKSGDDGTQCLVGRLRRVIHLISIHVTLARQVTHQIAQRVLSCITVSQILYRAMLRRLCHCPSVRRSVRDVIT